jgi:astacin (peptidase family M12A)
MLNRRIFVLGGGGTALCASLASAQDDRFVCGTVDHLPAADAPLQLNRYSAETGFDIVQLRSVVDEFGLTPYGTVQFSRRWRRTDGLTPKSGVITLGVHFLDGSEDNKAVVRQAALSWLQGELGARLAFRFDVPRSHAQITITFKTSENSSVVGRESARHAARYPTMHLADVVPHVIQHEFGHAIGLQHEHQHPGRGIRWNVSNVLIDMAKQGWSAADVQANIFDRYSTRYACLGDPAFNPNSIMLYPIPKRWTMNGFSSGTNTTISPRDRRCVEALYRV